MPKPAPTTVPAASASSAPRTRGSRPARIKPACCATPTSVPIESNSARKKNTNTTAIMSRRSEPRISSCSNVGDSEGGRLATPRNSLSPASQAAALDVKMPMRMAPRTPRIMSTAMTANPTVATSTGALLRSPSVTSVPEEPTITPAHCRPTIAISSPIPTGMARVSGSGIAVISSSRRPKPAVTRNTRPAMATAPSATGQGTPLPATTANAK